MIAITHAPADGTVLEDTTRGGRHQPAAEPLGWRWSRRLGVWYLPASRDFAPRAAVITDTAEKLRAAGHEVIVAIDGGAPGPRSRGGRPPLGSRARADALPDKADRDAAAADAAHQRARELGDQIPFGQPILVGYHSEPWMRRHAQRIHTAMDTAVAAEQAQETERRAAVAAVGTAARYRPVTFAHASRN
jgi:hypothetical protein